jgi:hypothetical protein
LSWSCGCSPKILPHISLLGLVPSLCRAVLKGPLRQRNGGPALGLAAALPLPADSRGRDWHGRSVRGPLGRRRQAARQHTPGRPALGVRAAHPSRAGQRLHRCSGARAGGLAVRGRQLGGALPADRRSGGCLLLCQEEAPLQALMGEMSNIRAAGSAWRESSASCCQRKGVSAVTDAESCGVMGTLSSLAVRSTCRSAGSRIAHWRYPRCRNVPGGWPDSVTSSHEKRPADSSFVIL